ncbi:cytidylyltransferase domain-containing protein [Saccharibacillus endophyticus]|uniref:Spore coat protein n=1 Tax=Saccharibacillus endophyticus TaxID=2060666 RepID=A0ABQ2A6E6_9BACL|nr:glycosyltransferase family protein [Saccharibacillus endophyticus]GGH86986.1 spore coat protein [Saccharibacillus endophyticus]
MRIVAIIQARMGSTRLPGKVMKTLGDRTVLGHVIMRCQAIESVTHVIVATSTLGEDDAICIEAEKYGVSHYRGSQRNVLDRYYYAAKEMEADLILRITSDCPLLDPLISEAVIQDFLAEICDYSSSGLSNTFPRGLDTEIFTFAALEKSHREATVEYEREHVTPYIYQHPEIFTFRTYSNQKDESRFRLTLDTPQDWELIRKIYEVLYKGEIFYWEDVYRVLQENPEWPLINAEVQQKKLGE